MRRKDRLRYRATVDLSVIGFASATVEADSVEEAIEKMKQLGPYDFDDDPTWTSVTDIDVDDAEVEEMDAPLPADKCSDRNLEL